MADNDKPSRSKSRDVDSSTSPSPKKGDAPRESSPESPKERPKISKSKTAPALLGDDSSPEPKEKKEKKEKKDKKSKRESSPEKESEAPHHHGSLVGPGGHHHHQHHKEAAHRVTIEILSPLGPPRTAAKKRKIRGRAFCAYEEIGKPRQRQEVGRGQGRDGGLWEVAT